MKKRGKWMLLVTVLIALAGLQLGSFSAFAGNGRHGDRWDSRWDDDSEDQGKAGGYVNVIYFCEETNTVWANGEIWANGLVNGKGNVNSSELTNIPEGYELKSVGDFYYDGGAELRVQVIPKTGGYVNVVYFCEETNTVWANGEIWANGLVNGKGNVNSSELTNIPEGYELKSVGDFYYDGGAELRVQVIPKTGGYVNVHYEYHNPNGYVEGTIVENIWASQLVNGKGNVNSNELRGIPEGYHLRVLGDYYYNGDGMLEVEILKD